ncbi:hypothetical protein [uncultured Pedobacter sp.]|uniref:hypothetical protein n=1 Tax=uncultured Pedobacter sp. TaxID=246139 RepID=UPI0025E36746|nr:hypothetical protein [uncultured Pedobacter sp.]
MINRTKTYAISACTFLILFGGCKKAEKVAETTTPKTETTGAVATLTTSAFTNITTTSAMSGGVVSDKGGSPVTDQGVCWSTSPKPTMDNNKSGVVSASGSGVFTSEIKGLTASTKYYVRAFAVNKAGVAYGNEMELTTANIAGATFGFSPLYIVGSTVAAADIEVLTDGGDAVTERGIVYASTPSPTINSSKVKHNNAGLGKFRVSLKDLTPKTTYYARAYAINSKGASYSSEITFKTIAKGNVTYTINKSSNPTNEEMDVYARIKAAADSACWYLNNYTSATKNITLNYVPDVATADATNTGWVRYGKNTTYQKLRTTLHEFNHTLGTGTTDWWTGTAIVNGAYTGSTVNTLLKKITGKDAPLNGDKQHWWPYGLNQDSEVSSSWDYVYNCLIIEAMRKDGLPEWSSGTYTP